MATVTFLLWDEQNIAHIAGHGVVPAEVEQVVFLDETASTYKTTRGDRPGRIAVFGHTVGGRPLAVFLDRPAQGNTYVVSARPASNREQRTYFGGST
jgi:uncharacterized protein